MTKQKYQYGKRTIIISSSSNEGDKGNLFYAFHEGSKFK